MTRRHPRRRPRIRRYSRARDGAERAFLADVASAANYYDDVNDGAFALPCASGVWAGTALPGRRFGHLLSIRTFYSHDDVSEALLVEAAEIERRRLARIAVEPCHGERTARPDRS